MPGMCINLGAMVVSMKVCGIPYQYIIHPKPVRPFHALIGAAELHQSALGDTEGGDLILNEG